jgi:hypothetical protein
MRYLDKIIHQNVYPFRWNENCFNNKLSERHIKRINLPRSKYLSSALYSNQHLHNKTNGCDLQQAMQRYYAYLTKLNHIYSPTILIIDPTKVIHLFSF